jgi:hypothetical protein
LQVKIAHDVISVVRMAKRPTKMSGFIGLRLDPHMEKAINDWLDGMRPRPTKSEALRTLIEEGLKAVTAEKAEKPAKGRK